MKTALLAGLRTAIGFLAGQMFAWRELVSEGYVLADNPANSFFYLITGMHGLHILGGLVALSRTTIKAWQRRAAERGAAQRRTVRHLLAFHAHRLADPLCALRRLGQ